MPIRENSASKAWLSHTEAATLMAILAVLPGLIPAAIMVAIYSEMLHAITHSNGGIAGEWFAQVLWGLVAGAFAISVSQYSFNNVKIKSVRLLAIIFWSIGILFYVIFSLIEQFALNDITYPIANIMGLSLGFCTYELSGRNK